MHDTSNAYGLWYLVLINSAVFILFAFSFVKPKSKTDWRSLGAFSAFVLALFTEMYGFPLTVYLLSGWLGSKVPGLDLTHDAGHLWYALLGMEGDAHSNPIHLAANLAIFAGFWLIWAGWKELHAAHQDGSLATGGPYTRIRHPQYVGFVVIMVGFLLMWPTLPTLLMFPFLVWIYTRLAAREEAAVRAEFGAGWEAWAKHTPAFLPWARPRPLRGTTPDAPAAQRTP